MSIKRPNFKSLASVGVITMTFCVMLAWTWGRWTDPLVDSGRELYVPWQITGGHVLYRDLAYFNGPVSPYFNSLIFKLLGVGLRSIIIANLAILILIVSMLYFLMLRIADQFTATVGCVLMLLLFAFIELVPGSYNFVTPYSHEMTHGLALGLGVLCALTSFNRRPRRRTLLIAATLLGLVLLTKVEIAAATMFATVVGIALLFLAKKISIREIVAFAIIVIFVPTIAWLLFCCAMPAGAALRGVAGSWNYALDPAISGMQFYRHVLGIDDSPENVWLMLSRAVSYGLIAAAVIGFAKLFRTKKSRRAAIAISIPSALFVGIALFFLIDPQWWQHAFRGVGLITPLVAIWICIRNYLQADEISVLRAMFAIFAAALLGKIIFAVNVFHYGFVLAMPAVLFIFCVGGLYWLPRWIDSRGGCGEIARVVVLMLLALATAVHLNAYRRFYSHRATHIGSGPDAFDADPLVDARGAAMNLMLDRLKDFPQRATLAVWPQGVMLNYLSRRENSTPYFTLMPPELVMFGEENIAEEYAKHPPDYIVIAPRTDLREYGYSNIAISMPTLMHWFSENYEPVNGAYLDQFQLLLYRRKI